MDLVVADSLHRARQQSKAMNPPLSAGRNHPDCGPHTRCTDYYLLALASQDRRELPRIQLRTPCNHHSPILERPQWNRDAVEWPHQKMTSGSQYDSPNHSKRDRRMAGISLPLQQRKFGETTRPDRWWIQPVMVFLGLMAFVLYANWAAFQGQHYHHDSYLSPFYSPLLVGDPPHAWFGPPPSWLPQWLPFSPAF